jgi:hypothetical protein
MQTGYSRITNQAVVRFMKRTLLLFLILCLVPAAGARENSPAYSSVVLVLKLVSATHVRPTTGVVISDNGLVLVPADFASAEGEIIVLDGGVDILSNGRPATVVNESIPGGLAILSVAGLSRPGITMSDIAFNPEAILHLAAFPPAEYIAKGAEPLWQPVKLLIDDLNMPVSISPETPLPYVTGAILDDCGFLVGLGLAKGSQSLEIGNPPTTIFIDELSGILDSMKVAVPTAICMKPEQLLETTAISQDTVQGLPEPSEANEQAQEPLDTSTATDESAPSETQGAPVQRSSVDTTEGGVAISDKVSNVVNKSEPPSLWRNVPIWLPLLALLAMGALIWKGIFFLRLRRNDPKQPPISSTNPGLQPASDEPDTEPLETVSGGNEVKPRSAPIQEIETLDLDARPEGCNGVLLIEGNLDPDTDFKRFCFVNTDKIDVVIGRGEADITIEHTAISRNHARIKSHGELMTLSDLGSKNGTFIGDIPCLQGEIMFVGPQDEVSLGDVRFKISVVRQEAEWA